MITFINWLRALAAVFITNSHYEGIYPIDLLANGGLIGDVLFFAVSGFCLCNIKLRFDKWYLKRIVRIYPAVIIITAVYLALGLYKMSTFSFVGVVNWFIYPTNYHFVASIMVLYIPFYIFMSIKRIKEHLPVLLAIVTGVWIAVYVLLYDKSTYHIDTVREPMIRFLYFEAMLIGALFRVNFEKEFQNRWYNWVLMIMIFLIYFISKLAFSRIDEISEYQIVNQFAILILLYSIFRCFAGIDDILKKSPKKLNKAVDYLSKTTLEIYLVQYGILVPIKELGFVFPLNWLMLTAAILLLSGVLHICVKMINKPIDKGMVKIVK